ncbi:MAG: glycerate kinase [Treponema sp.]|jgi:glycerate kinase|nr:glycerate kinase [Treponema sp.]
MNILIAPDSFKGNMSAAEVCAAIERGIIRADRNAGIFKIPLADGGEGTAKTLTEAAGGRLVKTPVTDPLGRTIEAVFGLIENGRTAVLDMAGASGMELLRREELNPLKASSRGTGELIRAALNAGAVNLIIGIGGSATNDGGIGMLGALGFRFLDEKGEDSGEGGEALAKIHRMESGGADPRLKTVSIQTACDVTNPLTGTQGASAVFGPQKGADPLMVKFLDEGLSRLGKIWIQAGLAQDTDQKGDGAAGGMGAALRICLGAKMESGAMLVMRYAGFFEALEKADLVITGEGRTDSQSAGGKLCSTVARESRKAGVPAALLSGALEGDCQNLFPAFDYAVSISRGQPDLDSMIRDSSHDLSLAAENLIRALILGRNL